MKKHYCDYCEKEIGGTVNKNYEPLEQIRKLTIHTDHDVYHPKQEVHAELELCENCLTTIMQGIVDIKNSLRKIQP